MKIHKKLWKMLGSVKFAIPLLLAFTIAMIVGTVLESRYGTSYASLTVYNAWWFYSFQALMCASLIVSVIDRLPFRKRLFGFYIIHTAAVSIIIGSVITKVNGIDAEITLNTVEPTNQARLPESVLYVGTSFRQSKYELPKTVKPQSRKTEIFKDDFLEIYMLNYLPYAKEIRSWIPQAGSWGLDLEIKNNKFSEKVQLSQPPANGIDNQVQMGPLYIAILQPTEFDKKVIQKLDIPELFFNGEGQSLALIKLPMKRKLASTGKVITVDFEKDKKIGIQYYTVSYEGQLYRVFPKYSEYPIDKHLEVNKSAPFRIVDKGLVGADSPEIYLTKKSDSEFKIAFKKNGKWEVSSFLNGAPIELPWMNLSMEPSRLYMNKRPYSVYEADAPDKDAQKNIKAALLEVKVKSKSGQLAESKFWVSDQSRENINLLDFTLGGHIGRKLVSLPFNLQLNKFKMDTNPGTMEAASYESFVSVNGSKTLSHIFMNNPLKKDGYTLYQASYFQDESGAYQSILSVNQDSGRWLKYLGSLLLVLGLTFHYIYVYRQRGLS